MRDQTVSPQSAASELPEARAKAVRDRAIKAMALIRENQRFVGTGGVSRAKRTQEFRPAFRDRQTDVVYPSCYANGRPAGIHLLDSLPGELVERRDAGACRCRKSFGRGRFLARRAVLHAGGTSRRCQVRHRVTRRPLQLRRPDTPSPSRTGAGWRRVSWSSSSRTTTACSPSRRRTPPARLPSVGAMR